MGIQGAGDDGKMVYTWTCPICGQSRTSYLLDAAGGNDHVSRAVRALRTHVTASAGKGHGPRNEFPPDLDPDTLAEYVTREG